MVDESVVGAAGRRSGSLPEVLAFDLLCTYRV